MAKKHGGPQRRMSRLAGVVGGVAVTALAISFAWTVVGGALRPATSPLPVPIVIAASSQPVPSPPLAPPRKPAAPRASVKVVSPESKQSARKTSTAEKMSSAPSGTSKPAETGSATSSAAPASSFLSAESKASRTRGQPEQE